MAASREVPGDHKGGLLDHVGLERHAFHLQRRQVLVRFNEPGLPGYGVAHAVLHEANLFGQHHPPRKAVSLLVPPDIAGIREMAQGKGQLHRGEQRQPDQKRPGPPGLAGRMRRLGAGPPIRHGNEPQQPSRPVGLKKYQRQPDHQPGENAELREQDPGSQVERYQYGVGERPGAPPQ